MNQKEPYKNYFSNSWKVTLQNLQKQKQQLSKNKENINTNERFSAQISKQSQNLLKPNKITIHLSEQELAKNIPKNSIKIQKYHIQQQYVKAQKKDLGNIRNQIIDNDKIRKIHNDLHKGLTHNQPEKNTLNLNLYENNRNILEINRKFQQNSCKQNMSSTNQSLFNSSKFGDNSSSDIVKFQTSTSEQSDKENSLILKQKIEIENYQKKSRFTFLDKKPKNDKSNEILTARSQNAKLLQIQQENTKKCYQQMQKKKAANLAVNVNNKQVKKVIDNKTKGLQVNKGYFYQKKVDGKESHHSSVNRNVGNEEEMHEDFQKFAKEIKNHQRCRSMANMPNQMNILGTKSQIQQDDTYMTKNIQKPNNFAEICKLAQRNTTKHMKQSTQQYMYVPQQEKEKAKSLRQQHEDIKDISYDINHQNLVSQEYEQKIIQNSKEDKNSKLNSVLGRLLGVKKGKIELQEQESKKVEYETEIKNNSFTTKSNQNNLLVQKHHSTKSQQDINNNLNTNPYPIQQVQQIEIENNQKVLSYHSNNDKQTLAGQEKKQISRISSRSHSLTSGYEVTSVNSKQSKYFLLNKNTQQNNGIKPHQSARNCQKPNNTTTKESINNISIESNLDCTESLSNPLSSRSNLQKPTVKCFEQAFHDHLQKVTINEQDKIQLQNQPLKKPQGNRVHTFNQQISPLRSKHDQNVLDSPIPPESLPPNPNLKVPNASYLSNQPQLTSSMRLILVDWLMEVSSEFMLKKETFCLAIYYVDLYLSIKEVERSKLQLVGVTSLWMASKIEELLPQRLEDFVKSTDDGYSKEEIKCWELQMTKAFKWKLTYQTVSTWFGFISHKWDQFLDEEEKNLNENIKEELYYIRKPKDKYYQNYRQLSQLLDVCMMDINSLQYQPKILVFSFLYLLLGILYEQFDIETVFHEFRYSSRYLFSDSQGINELYNKFLLENFNIITVDLLPTIQYCSTFFDMNFYYALPPAAALVQKENPINNNYEEFITYQIHYPDGLNYIKGKQHLMNIEDFPNIKE